jgi:hypothetical protein
MQQHAAARLSRAQQQAAAFQSVSQHGPVACIMSTSQFDMQKSIRHTSADAVVTPTLPAFV